MSIVTEDYSATKRSNNIGSVLEQSYNSFDIRRVIKLYCHWLKTCMYLTLLRSCCITIECKRAREQNIGFGIIKQVIRLLVQIIVTLFISGN